ncbi:MAG: hypothetical protein IJ001_03405 [Oscillospiraceae bacterium]|nr:hypothetical protein [Oscillospiraceae bacterium]
MKAAFRKMNESIRPTPGLEDQVFEKIAVKHAARFRPLAAVAAMLVVVMLATPAMAASIPAVSDWLYQVSPEMAERFTPIQESCTKNGIKMEVVSASIHGATSEVVVSFEDLEGNRIGSGTREDYEFRNYNIFKDNGSGQSVKGLSDDKTGYDPETGKKTMLVETNYHGVTVSDLFGSKMTIVVDEICNYLDSVSYEVPIVLTDNAVMTAKPDRSQPTDRPVEVPFDGFGYGSATRNDPWLTKEVYELLTPGEVKHQITEEVAVMGMAYIDGRLHVQTRQRDADADTFSGYQIYLVESNGEKLCAAVFNTFTIDEGDDRGDYMEGIFDIPEEELENYTLMADVEYKETIKGPWKVTFTFTESDYVGEHDDGIPMETAIG